MTMKNMFRSFLRSEEGFVLSTEAVLIGTILVLGMIVGLAEIRNAVVQELGDYSQAVNMLSQDFAYTSVTSTNVNTNIQTSGSQFSDSTDIQRANGTVANGIGVATVSVLDAE
jgi:Flp pilus assembly pilin Flp